MNKYSKFNLDKNNKYCKRCLDNNIITPLNKENNKYIICNKHNLKPYHFPVVKYCINCNTFSIGMGANGNHCFNCQRLNKEGLFSKDSIKKRNETMLNNNIGIYSKESRLKAFKRRLELKNHPFIKGNMSKNIVLKRNKLVNKNRTINMINKMPEELKIMYLKAKEIEKDINGCIYALLRDNEYIYIGEVQSKLHNRIIDHYKGNSATKKKLFNNFIIIENNIFDKENRLIKEDYYVNLYKPIYNKRKDGKYSGNNAFYYNKNKILI